MRLGPYEIEGELARTTGGVVYEARHRGRSLAVKLVRSSTPDQRTRFERERRLLATLGEADGFVPLLDAGAAPEGAWLAMPLLRGGTLRDRLMRAPLALDEAVTLVASLARAMNRAHAIGVVHRDLRPENVLYTERGVPLVADLGVAKHFGDGKTGARAYMSPEQIADPRGAGPHADVFALGAILHECLAGVPPDGTPLRARRRDVPPALEAVVARALAPNPGERFPNAGAFLLALSTAARPHGGRARLLALLGLLVLAGAGAAAAFLDLGRLGLLPKAPPVFAPPAATTVVLDSPGDGTFCEADELALHAHVSPGPATDARLDVTYVTPLGAAQHTTLTRTRPIGTDGTVAFENLEAPPRETTCALRLTILSGTSPIASAAATVTVVPVPSALPVGLHLDDRFRLANGRPVRLYKWRLPDGTAMSMVYVPAGPFIFGTKKETRATRAFWIGRYETTRREYDAFCTATHRPSAKLPPYADRLDRIERHPVSDVTFAEVDAFLAWAGLRLPTTEEWQKAARGTDGRRYPWGDAWDPKRANHGDRSTPSTYGKDHDLNESDGAPYTAPVGTFPGGVSPYGAEDMAGNVWELTSDRTFFGGSWWTPGRSLVVFEGARFSRDDGRALDVGFRVALSAP